jgi:hypothetical protein
LQDGWKTDGLPVAELVFGRFSATGARDMVYGAITRALNAVSTRSAISEPPPLLYGSDTSNNGTFVVGVVVWCIVECDARALSRCHPFHLE